ncbi:hypothetical protein, partial [Paenibacillus xylanexedens]
MKLKKEEMVCVIMLVGCVMRGGVGWRIECLWVEDMVSGYLIVMF